MIKVEFTEAEAHALVDELYGLATEDQREPLRLASNKLSDAVEAADSRTAGIIP